MTSQRPRGDAGASLVIVLAFLTLAAALCSGLLAITGGNYQAMTVVREVQQRNYASDAAIEYGIARAREDLDRGVAGDTSCAWELLGNNGLTTSVRCEGLLGSGAGGDRLPKHAILALATSGAGILLDKNDPLNVNGSVYARSDIVPDNGNKSALVATGNVTSEGDCSSSKISSTSGRKRCNTTSVPGGMDPGYASRAGSRFAALPSTMTYALNPAPTCSTVSGQKVATFSGPGGYVKFSGVSPTTLAATCAGSQVIVFTPGVVYLEDVPFDTGSYDVIAGTLNTNGWTGGGTKRDGTDCAATGPGTQLLLGGSSRLVVPNQTTAITLCGGPNSTGPSIPLFGASQTAAGVRALSGVALTQRAVVTDNKPNFFAHGTVYMPSASLELWLHNRARTSINRGIIVRSLLFHASPSTTQAAPAISLPSCETSSDCRADRHVVFTSSVAGQDQIRTEVNLDDASGGVPGLTADVAGWSVLR